MAINQILCGLGLGLASHVLGLRVKFVNKKILNLVHLHYITQFRKLRTLQPMTNLQHLSEGWAAIYLGVDGDRIPGST